VCGSESTASDRESRPDSSRAEELRNARSYDSYISSLPEAKAVSSVNLVTAKLVEDDEEATFELQKKMKAKEDFLFKQLAQMDVKLRAKEEELRKMETSSATTTETQATGEFGNQRTLQKDEVWLGRLLAAGTFNSVHAVKGIILDEQSYRWVPREHIQQRQQLVETSKQVKLVVKALNASLDPTRQNLAYKRLLYEAKLLMKCSHPNIISIVGMASADVLYAKFFFLMHRIDQTLFECITKSWNKRQRGKHKFLFHQIKAASDIAAGLDYLHSRNIMLSDLKPEVRGIFDCLSFSKRSCSKLTYLRLYICNPL
jgi:serine/threonine protein kinase